MHDERSAHGLFPCDCQWELRKLTLRPPFSAFAKITNAVVGVSAQYIAFIKIATLPSPCYADNKALKRAHTTRTTSSGLMGGRPIMLIRMHSLSSQRYEGGLRTCPWLELGGVGVGVFEATDVADGNTIERQPRGDDCASISAFPPCRSPITTGEVAICAWTS